MAEAAWGPQGGSPAGDRGRVITFGPAPGTPRAGPALLDDFATPTGLSISKEDINKLPVGNFAGVVHWIRGNIAAEAALQQLRKETVLGFDTETKPAFRKGQWNPPALIQLAGAEAVYVFRLQDLSNSVHEGLAALLANSGIKKAGVGINCDIKELQRTHHFKNFKPGGFVELGEAANPNGKQLISLRALAAIYMGVRISKTLSVSNWAHPEISNRHILYAATDAWVCREVVLKIPFSVCHLSL